MATHGRSGVERWLLGSVAEKVLRGAINPLLLIRATKEAKSEGEASPGSVIVPLDGSELAEQVLPSVVELAKQLALEVVLFRAYTIPISAMAVDPRRLLCGNRRGSNRSSARRSGGLSRKENRGDKKTGSRKSFLCSGVRFGGG